MRQHQRLQLIPRSPLAPNYVQEDDRTKIARHLLHDAELDPGDRFAGLLVVLYGQHLSRIAVLRDADVKDGPARVRLGEDWLELPEPMEDIARAVLARAGRAQWLFRGVQPGRHMSEEALNRRLARFGIRARAMRIAAIFHLSAEFQPHTLYRLLGLHPNTAVHWSRVAGSSYASYWEPLINDEGDDFDDGSGDGDVLVELGLDSEEAEFWIE